MPSNGKQLSPEARKAGLAEAADETRPFEPTQAKIMSVGIKIVDSGDDWMPPAMVEILP
ncbi:MAG: hypothetical protein HKL81_07170 [Acidimicrobiaceae bacterium]|nr:hypothetical protein [Acidimicrobiaceae bacterium]